MLGLESTARNDRELISQGKALSAPDVRRATELGWTPENQGITSVPTSRTDGTPRTSLLNLLSSPLHREDGLAKRSYLS